MRIIPFLILLPLHLCAQAPAAPWVPPAVRTYAFLNSSINRFSNPAALAPLLAKLRAVGSTKKGVVRIVHIGDSHIQADMMTGPVRAAFQSYFGDAGRGLVFPYQVAGSNAPLDVTSSSPDGKGGWRANRLAHPEIPVACGLAGFGIHALTQAPRVQIGLKALPDADDSVPATFNRVRTFLGRDSGTYRLTAEDLYDTSRTALSVAAASVLFDLPKPVSSATFSPELPATRRYSLYGFSLEKRGATGVIYDGLGVNGAQFYQYNQTPLFWEALPLLRADAYVLSMGTNEAQRTRLDRDSFLSAARRTVRMLRAVSPKAVIVLTTPPGSYTKAGGVNTVVGQVAGAILQLAREEGLPCWDLYGISGGIRSAGGWKATGLMSKDGVHYTKEGYRVQGTLFAAAWASAFVGKPAPIVADSTRK